MATNVIVALYDVESEAFQAFTELKQNPGEEKKSHVSQAALLKKKAGVIRTLDDFDTGSDTLNDAALGGVVGGLFGILGGPIGVLLGASYGALIGSALDLNDALDDQSIIEQIASKMEDGDVAIIGLAVEEDETILDQKLEKFNPMIIRYDAAVVNKEVQQAEEMAKDMAKQARKELRTEKKESMKEKVKEKLHID